MTGLRRAVRLAVLAAAAATLLAGVAAPAAAHGGGTDATNYHSRITESPPLEGVEWRVYSGDELLWVENRSGEELIVSGDRGEPYLRIGPDGVWENRIAEVTHPHEAGHGRDQVDDTSDDKSPPDWERVSTQARFAWHDHRIHVSGSSPHPRVTDPGERTQVMQWTVPFTLAGQEHELVGEVVWVPAPPWWPWLAVGLGLTLPALIGLRTQPVEGRWPGLARPAAVVLGVVVAANLAFLVDDLLAVPLPVVTRLSAATQTALFLALGVFGAWRGWQARDGAFIALAVGAGGLFVGRGLLLWSVLGASQLSTVFPDVVPRVVVGTNLMLAVPFGVVAVIGTRRLLPAAGPPDSREHPAGASG